MLNIDRVYDLAIDLSKVSSMETSIKFKQYDYNSCFIHLGYHNNGEIIDNIKGNNIIGVFRNSKRELFVDENTNLPVKSLGRTLNDNTVMMMIPDQVLKYSGKIECETIIITPSKKRVTSPTFTFEIEESLFDIDFE